MTKIDFNKISKILAVFAVLFIIFGGYLISKQKTRTLEVKNLPFFNVKLEDVEDGIYHNKTETSFMIVELEVAVENHQFKDIKILESEGVDCESAKPIVQEMIKQNKSVVPAIKGAELGSLVYISCVDGALHNSLLESE